MCDDLDRRSSGPTLAEEAKLRHRRDAYSTKADPVGVAGLQVWLARSSWKPLRRRASVVSEIEKYPERVEKGERGCTQARVRRSGGTPHRRGNGHQLDFDDALSFIGAPNRSVSSLVVGKDESPSYTMLRFQETKDPTYCRLSATVFADVSWLPRFAVSWVMDATRDELASAYREMIRRGLESPK